jgi:hypothetical protein
MAPRRLAQLANPGESMKQLEIRRADLQTIFVSFDWWEDRQARECYERDFKNAPATDTRHGAKLVLHEWETDAEADKARLDWLERNWMDAMEWEWLNGLGEGLRDQIDAARNAPKPKVTVIATPEGEV